MDKFFVWARRLDSLSELDHTWVTTYRPVMQCPPEQEAYWYCWGDCHTTTEDAESRLLCEGDGDSGAARVRSVPNDPDDHAGLKGFYGQHGVCHQVANRILAAAGTNMNVDDARGSFWSYLLYGRFGSEGAFRMNTDDKLSADVDFQAVADLLGNDARKTYADEVCREIREIQLQLVREKEELTQRVAAGEMSVSQFADGINQILAGVAPRLRELIGVESAARLLGTGDPILLSPRTAEAEDHKRK